MGVGHEDEETIEAEAGGILEAETAIDVHGLRLMVESYIEALNNAPRG